MKILILNAGSSSQKSCLYELSPTQLPDQPPIPLWEAHVDWTQRPGFAKVEVKTAHGAILHQEMPADSRLAVMAHLLASLWNGATQVVADPAAIAIVGHRVVHGGPDYCESVVVTPAVKAAISRFATFAPVHNPANLEGIEAVEQMLGAVPQVAVFDTAFHGNLLPAAAVYPIPYEWFEQGIRRYGFHGISHRYCAHRAAQLLHRDLDDLRLISCHLGNGCSLAAIRHGRSIDTTMGFTPMDGLMMGSRSGAVDPGILIHLMRQENYTADQLDRMLNHESGLLGVSGVSGDMRQIAAAIADHHPRAQLALDVYLHRLRAAIAALLPALGGLDALIFTAGVGENAAMVRAATCEGLGFLGVAIDPLQNQAHPLDQDIATPESAARVLVIHTQEDWAIAQECWQWVHSEL